VSSSYFALPGGKISFGPTDLDNYTIGQVKQHVFEMVGDGRDKIAPLEKQRLWWNGYLLDNEIMSISEACVGIDAAAENISGAKELTIFLTIAAEDNPQAMLRTRKSSFDIRLQSILMKQKSGKGDEKAKCTVS
jgi:hypothetical protein